VRPKRGENSKQRIEKQMRRFEVWAGGDSWQSAWDSRLHVVEGDVTLPRMGMPDAVYETLAREVDAILHGAAHVNFIYPYEALRATNVLGIHEIIRFAFHSRIKPVHHLSTAAIWPMGAQNTYYEKDPIDHVGALNLGYDEAKWVGERCLLHAAERGLPVARYRPGEVGGDSKTGRCVTDHFLIACFKGFLQFGAFPKLDIEVDVAPVDYVAKAIVYLAFRRNPLGRAFHLTNPHRRPLSDALMFLRSFGYQFDELPFEELRDRLVNSRDFAMNALFAYQAALEEMDHVSMQLPTYDTRETQRELAGSGIHCPAADEKLFETYMRYLQETGFIPRPEVYLSRI
jgi:thioester reductase-like protein